MTVTSAIRRWIPCLRAMALAFVFAAAACTPGGNAGGPAVSGADVSTAASRPPELRDVALRGYGGLYVEGPAPAYLEAVGRRIAAANDLGEWRFTMVDSPAPNAFTIGTREVFVARGLLAVLQDEAELASVVGHEMAHVVAGHRAQRAAQRAQALSSVVQVARNTRDPQLASAMAMMELTRLQAYSREHEFEADRIAIRLIAKAGYDPDAAASALRRILAYEGFAAREAGRTAADPGRGAQLDSHPRTVDRVEAARREIGGAAGGRREAEAYLAATDGLLFGDSPREGFARGRRFVHPQLGFAFDAPAGYRLLNGPRAVLAVGPTGSGMVFTCVARAPEGATTDAMRRLYPNINLVDARELRVNGMEAATAVAGRAAGAGDSEMRVVAIRYDGSICTFRMVWTGSGGAELLQAAQTFRRLSASDAAMARPLRLRVVDVAPGESTRSLAARTPFDDGVRRERFELINGLDGGENVAAGRRVRVVVAE
ncbi:MAG: M48 family metalloprotease [Rhodospirillales bacterium]|nr:MAG: M48 family metalloprotease [Rhodospirillales bacterium]